MARLRNLKRRLDNRKSLIVDADLVDIRLTPHIEIANKITNFQAIIRGLLEGRQLLRIIHQVELKWQIEVATDRDQWLDILVIRRHHAHLHEELENSIFFAILGEVLKIA